MTLLIDANILLDVLQNREPHVRTSTVIWKLCETEKARGCVSVLSFANLVYVMRKELDAKKIEETLKALSLIFEFADFNVSDLIRAAEMKWDDFEDAVQSATAERLRADYIITRNVKDFARSRVTAFTPSELLARI